MDRAGKKELIDSLRASLTDTGTIVVAHYTGMTVAHMNDFRARVKAAGGSVKVTKNRLAKLSLKDTDAAGIIDLFSESFDTCDIEDVLAHRSADDHELVVDLGVIDGNPCGRHRILRVGDDCRPLEEFDDACSVRIFQCQLRQPVFGYLDRSARFFHAFAEFGHVGNRHAGVVGDDDRTCVFQRGMKLIDELFFSSSIH